jgi:hypothetical protein
MPWLGASASRTFLGITVSNTCPPKKLRRSAATCLDSVVRSSYIVRRMPSTARAGLIVRRMRKSVSRSSDTPSIARNSHWMGTKTESLAASALSVRRSSVGGQSIRMYAYLSRTPWIASLSLYSLRSIETISTAAPTRFLSDGTSESPSVFASTATSSMGSPKMIVLYDVLREGSRWNPSELVALAWGSKSIISVFCAAAASEAPRFTAVVVLPTPPF